MYNRYIPQPDGSYRRDKVPETKQPTRRPQPLPPHRPAPPPPPANCPPPPPVDCPPPQSPVPIRKKPHSEPQGIGSFLKQLLPKELDTADLLIILLLLLMAGEKEEEKNNALLTMALYFLM